MQKIITPRLLKGFRDSLPEMEVLKRKLTDSLEKHFLSHGYLPIDTPALEYSDILLSKGSGETEKQAYRFTDHGGRDVTLRFDLTIPFARFVATNRHNITLPFKRYHLGKVWRGENTQRGRFREFIQCDFDNVGSDTLSADMEILLMIHSSLNALDCGKLNIHVNHRGVFNALLEKLGLEKPGPEILCIIDKLPKIGADEVRKQIIPIAGENNTRILVDYVNPKSHDNQEKLHNSLKLIGREAESLAAFQRLKNILTISGELQIPVIYNPSIARGLDYYTGVVFETFLDEFKGIGSICSGGRYDNLTGLFMKESVAGVGASIGLDRLMDALKDLDRLTPPRRLIDVIILMFDESYTKEYHTMAERCRENGLSAEVYPEPRKLGQQFRYAEARGIRFALLAGKDEFKSGHVSLKDLQSRESFTLTDVDEACNMAIKSLQLP